MFLLDFKWKLKTYNKSVSKNFTVTAVQMIQKKLEADKQLKRELLVALISHINIVISFSDKMPVQQEKWLKPKNILSV